MPAAIDKLSPPLRRVVHHDVQEAARDEVRAKGNEQNTGDQQRRRCQAEDDEGAVEHGEDGAPALAPAKRAVDVVLLPHGIRSHWAREETKVSSSP